MLVEEILLTYLYLIYPKYLMMIMILKLLEVQKRNNYVLFWK